MLLITPSVDDQNKSINELINAGIKTHEQRNKHFERNKNKGVSALKSTLTNYPFFSCRVPTTTTPEIRVNLVVRQSDTHEKARQTMDLALLAGKWLLWVSPGSFNFERF